MTKHPHRIYTFDLLRGLAVLTMMLAHSVYFFHNRGNDFLVSVEGFGNTVSFVTFLLVSGAVVSVAYVNHQQSNVADRRDRLLSRVVLLTLAYYVLAFVLTWSDLINAGGFYRIQLALDILSFRYLPGFMEYFPPFIFYSALIALSPRMFLTASRSIKNVVIVSLLALGLGWLLYQLPVGSLLKPWLALLAGGEGLYRFPLLQYLPVFLLGLYWGKRTVESESLKAKARLCFQFALFFSGLAFVAYFGAGMVGISSQTMFSRWPPSIPFLALGLAFAFLVASFLYAFHQLRRIALLRDFLLLFGQNALGLFWAHIFLLGLYQSANGPQVSSIGTFLFFLLLLVILSLALATFIPFNFRLALTLVRGSREEHEEELSEEAVFRLSKDVANDAVLAAKGLRHYFWPNPRTTNKRTLRTRHILGASILALVGAALLFPGTIAEISFQRQQQEAGKWWSDDFAYRQQLSIRNTEPFITINQGDVTTLQFNHQALVEQGKSRADGRDVALVYWTGEKHIVAESVISNPGSNQATLQFRVPARIQAGKQEQFYSLYYGRFIAGQPAVPKLESTAAIIPTFSQEESYPIVARVAKSWSLIGETGGDTISINLTTQERSETQTATYQIVDTGLTGSMTQAADNTWNAVVPVNSLKAGAYKIQATLFDGEKQQTSQITGFYHSQPLYIAWTQDWEGYDVSRTYLDAIESIANKYQLPITHFVSPRIFITDTIKPQQAKFLASWLQRRLTMGDGFGLHLHSYLDFVEQAGVIPKTEPNWGDQGDGYGVPLSAYTIEEQEILIKNALDLLFANGLPKTNMFRAGGWFANLDTFSALEKLGFTVDSSARTKYEFGRNRLAGPWDISPTTKPYYPSRTNQNRSDASNKFPILEIPNNGADSYAFSAQDMIDRFTVNFGTGILDEAQQITYLSHPHWFDEQEQTRVRELFEYISRYTFSKDQGPVVFTKTEALAEVWEKTLR